MSKSNYLDQLKTHISLLTEEELVIVLHVYNDHHCHYNCHRMTSQEKSEETLKADIDILNGLNNLKDIKKLVINYFEDCTDYEIEDFLFELIDFKSKNQTTNFDFNSIKNNARFLNFACHIVNNNRDRRELENFKSKYFNFLYVALTFSEYRTYSHRLERIKSDFSEIYSKYNSHFTNNEDKFFYIWAKKYMDENPAYKSRDYHPTEDSEYPLIVNSIFDRLYYENPEVHYALRKKLSNAWYQKQYREKNKGKKENYYALTKKAKECLKALCYKRNLSEDEVIESLINEHYVKECCNKNGEPLYG